MQSQSIPKNLDYNKLKPIGFPSHVQHYVVTPTSFSNANTNDVIRFNIDMNGFWDPYSTYIKLTVDTSDMEEIGSLQLDNSAHSFINQFLLYKNGVEIERIDEYDVLASILNDMHYSPELRNSKRHEGLGVLTCENQGYWSSTTKMIGQILKQDGGPIVKSDGGVFDATTVQDLVNQLKTAKFVQEKSLNPIGFKPQLNLITGNSIYSNESYFQDGNVAFDKLKYIQSRADNVMLLQDLSCSIDHSQTNIQQYFFDDTITQSNAFNDGYIQPFSTAFSSSGNEPKFSKKFYQKTMIQGKPGVLEKCTKQTFCIPLLSGIFGVLMPIESYKYIPMELFQNLVIEFRLNPHAMFTSGYQDSYDNITIANNAKSMTQFQQLKRIWKITQFELHTEIHHFEPEIEQIVLDQADNDQGIILHTNSWQLGPQYTFGPKEVPNGSYQINMGFESLKSIMFCFLPDDFQKYTFCRKQYRISHNLRELQYKIGQEYYPQQPIKGNAGVAKGRSYDNWSDGNNNEFIMETFKTFGKLYDISTDSFINQANFAINHRVYNPENINPGYTQDGTNLTVNQLDTALGMPLFHENRCVGKAVYAINLETLNQDNSVISGLNTIQNKPFEIILRSNTSPLDSTKIQKYGITTGAEDTNALGQFERQSTMYTFCHYDMLIQIRKSGISVLGRG